MKLAAIQMVSGASVQGNLDRARALLIEAADAGAELAILRPARAPSAAPPLPCRLARR